MQPVAGSVAVRGLQDFKADTGRLLVCLVDETTDPTLGLPSLGQYTDISGQTSAAHSLPDAIWQVVQQQVSGRGILDASAASDWARYAILDAGIPDREAFTVRFRNVPAESSRSWTVIAFLFDDQNRLEAIGSTAWSDPANSPASPVYLKQAVWPSDPSVLLKAASPPWPQTDLYVGLVDLAPHPRPGGTLESGGSQVDMSDASVPFVREVQQALTRDGASPALVRDLSRWQARHFPGVGRSRTRLARLSGHPEGAYKVFAVWQRAGGIRKVALATPAANATEVLLDGEQANLAPGDAGDPTVTHEFTFVSGGLSHPFVWVPKFDAWQLIDPSRSGGSLGSLPAGAWVGSEPSAGTPHVDWAKESFGGFYVAKYEASRLDGLPGAPVTGSGATEGTSGSLKIARFCVPWTGLSWQDADAACRAFHPDAHLMREDEWVALDIWRATRAVATLRGNNADLRDTDDGSVTFVQDPVGPAGRALTGTGTSGSWASGTDLTAHDGTTAGIVDLLGNVQELTLGLSVVGGRALVDGADAGPAANLWVTTLATTPDLRRFGVPASGGGLTSDSPYFNAIYFGSGTRPVRGGTYGSGIRTLLSASLLSVVPADGTTGFRPVVSF